MASTFIFLWDSNVCKCVCLCVYICFWWILISFLFPFVLSYSGLFLLYFILFWLFFTFLLFSNEKQIQYLSRLEEREGRTKRNWGWGNNNQNIFYEEKSIFNKRKNIKLYEFQSIINYLKACQQKASKQN